MVLPFLAFLFFFLSFLSCSKFLNSRIFPSFIFSSFIVVCVSSVLFSFFPFLALISKLLILLFFLPQSQNLTPCLYSSYIKDSIPLTILFFLLAFTAFECNPLLSSFSFKSSFFFSSVHRKILGSFPSPWLKTYSVSHTFFFFNL